MEKILGIDLGITSVGYGVIDSENNILDYGVRLFDEASASNNSEGRRSFRGQRRLKSRRKNRINAIKYYLLNIGLINNVNFVYYNNIYDLRIKGLNSKLTNVELANVLVNIAKRRGSSLEVAVDEDNSEDAKLASALSCNTKELKTRGLYVCQLQKERLESKGFLRGQDNIFSSKDYEKELRQILSNQELKEEYVNDIVDIVLRRRKFSEGPGSEDYPTPYGSYREEIVNGEKVIKHVNLIDEMRGKCSLYPNELRAPKNSYSAYKFNLLNDLNNLTIHEDEKVSTDKKKEILNYVKENGNITWKKLLKLLDVTQEEVKGYRVNTKNQPLLTSFDAYNKIIKDVNKDIISNEDYFDSIIDILTNTLIIEDRKVKLKQLALGLTDDEIDFISNLSKINGYHSLSLKAIKEINAEMLETSDNQMQIITKNKLGKTSKQEIGPNIIFDDEAILSAAAKRVHRQAIRVINELRHEYGEFSKIIIETTRAKNSLEEKKFETDKQKRFLEEKEKTDKLLEDLEKDPSKYNTKTKLKIRLYHQQDGKTMYAGLPIDIDTLLNDESAYEIEHIIPYSISNDNSLNNKALASHAENQIKSTYTPWYYFSSGRNLEISGAKINNWDSYTVFVDKLFADKKISKKKYEYLLTQKDYSKYSEREEFIARNLVDTSYGIRTVMNTLKEYFKINGIDTKVSTIKGRITHDFRQRVQLDKNRDEYIHHAIDALIIAAVSNQKTFNEAFNLYFADDKVINNETGEVLSTDNPLDDSNVIRFVKDLKLIEATPFDFSYKVDKKTNRSFADQTIYSTRNYEGTDYVIKKYKDIYGPEGENLKKIFDNNKAKDKLLVARNDPITFELLEMIYQTYKNEKNPFLAYKNEHGEIRKHSKKGNGPVIKSLKYESGKLKDHLAISRNYNLENSTKKVVLLQNSSYRTDIYLSDDGLYQFVTVRRYHIKQKNGKNIIDKDEYSKLLSKKKIDLSKSKFLFSLNRNDIIDLVFAKEVDENMNVSNTHKYYRFVATKADNSNQIEVKLIERITDERQTPTIGKSIVKFDKYVVSPIGKYQKVEKEDLKLEW